MRALRIFALTVLCLGLLTGCTTMSGATAGTIVGGLTGAGIGAIAGDPVSGALIGSGVGLGAGALVGHENERARYHEDGFVYDDVWGATGHYERREVVRRRPPPPRRTRTVRHTTVYHQPAVQTTTTWDHCGDVVVIESHPVWPRCAW